MIEPTVLLERPCNHVAVVKLNRPHAANAINGELARELAQVVAKVEQDPDIRAAVIAGSGDRAFCAGADLKAVLAGLRNELYTESGGFAGFVDAERRKLWIAAIEHPALAGGLEIALSCDVIVSSENATFGLPEVSRGLVAAAGGLYRLTRRIGAGAALELIATAKRIDAAEAYRLHLIDHIVPPGCALKKATEIGAAVARNAPFAVGESLAVARRALDETDTRLRELSQAAALRNAATEDFKEGPQAFVEKRIPNWSGR